MVRVDGSLLRCKLMEIYDDAEFVFVGRFGNKVLEKNSYELADDFLNKRIVALDNAPLVDRSINRLMTSLRSKAPKSSAADKERTEPRIEKIECHEVDEGAQFLDQPV
ncbi:MAG: hypothetical protein COB04_07620 [Gammaproteobacteria bacterium]|nr:MAG: hypothetical protein COB04_07620 [Gammaproteobacteria bacterium]